MDFIIELKSRNALLFYFGALNFLLATTCALLSVYIQVEVAGVNAWYKPVKFALSIGIYSLTMAWLMAYLPQVNSVNICSWIIVLMLGFEIIYITFQASKGELSHFNQSFSLYKNLYGFMGIAATIVAFVTLYIAILFFNTEFPELPDY
jgi:hypothetical protein